MGKKVGKKEGVGDGTTSVGRKAAKEFGCSVKKNIVVDSVVETLIGYFEKFRQETANRWTVSFGVGNRTITDNLCIRARLKLLLAPSGQVWPPTGQPVESPDSHFYGFIAVGHGPALWVQFDCGVDEFQICHKPLPLADARILASFPKKAADIFLEEFSATLAVKAPGEGPVKTAENIPLGELVRSSGRKGAPKSGVILPGSNGEIVA